MSSLDPAADYCYITTTGRVTQKPHTVEIWFAASKALPDAQAQRWEQAFAAMQADGSYARILRKYDDLRVTRISDDRRRDMSGPLWAFPH